MSNRLLSTTNTQKTLMCLVLALFTTINAWAIPPSIINHPYSTAVCSLSSTAFVVNASNTTSYQWQVNTGGGFVNVTNGALYSGATTNVLTISSVAGTMSGYLYRCVCTGPDAPAATSNSATLTVNVNAAITSSPAASKTVCNGDNTSYTFGVTGTSITYQWYGYNGATYVPLSNAGFYSGVTTATLNITGITTGSSASTYSYYCIATGPCNYVSTSTLYLTVNAQPAITTNPVNKTVCEGSVALFGVVATGTALTYQWQVSYNGTTWTNLTNSGGYADVTTSLLRITTTGSMHGSRYRCVINGACAPQVISNPAILSVDLPLNITSQPANSSVCPNASTSFVIAVTGNNLTYQWQENTGGGWTNLANAGRYADVTTNSLKVSNIPSSYNGYRYRCILNGDCSPTTTSAEATLSLYSPTVVTSSPPAQDTVCEGDNKSYSITATGTAITYLWYQYNGTTYVPLTNGGFYSGVTTPTLTITGITTGATDTTYSYYCVATGLCNVASTSSTLYLRVNKRPSISSHPVSSTVCSGSLALFGVVAGGTDLKYQWQVSYNGTTWANLTNSGAYADVNTSLLRVTSNVSLHGTRYRCIVSGYCTPQVTSNPATLTVNSPLAITTQPSNSIVCPNASTSFVVAVTGSALTYQWQLNTGSGWTNLTNTGMHSDVTTNSLKVSNVTAAHNNYRYRCVINGNCSPVTISSEAVLTLYSPTVVTTSPPALDTICDGDSKSYSITATGTSVTYQWYVYNGTGYVAVTNSANYSGATTPTLNITGLSSGSTSTTYSYFCVATGLCNIASTSSTLYLTVNSRPSISTHPTNKKICAGSLALFGVVAGGTDLKYQWQVSYNGTTWANLTNGGAYADVTTSLLRVTTNISLHGTRYRCVINGKCPPSVTSNMALLEVDAPLVITQQPVNQTVCANSSTTFNVAVTGSALTYQWQFTNGAGWTNLTNTGIYSDVTTNKLKLSNITPAYNNHRYRCIIGGLCSPVTASAEGILTLYDPAVITSEPPAVSTACNGDNVTYTVTATGSGLSYQWYRYIGAGYVPLTNTGFYSGVTTPTLNITGITSGPTTTTYSYFCVATGTCNNASTNTLYLTVNSRPAITGQPLNKKVCQGTVTTFGVTATGTALNYQWQVSTNGTTWNNLTNAGGYENVTTSLLKITTAGAMNGNMYRCVVTGACTPTATSNPALLEVDVPLAITMQPANRVVCPNANTTFDIAATGSATTYQWQVSTNGTTWTNLANTGIYSDVTTSSLKLTAVTTVNNNYRYRCVVNALCSPATISGEAVLTFHTPIAISANPVSGTICNGDNASFTVTAAGTGITYQWYGHNGTSYVALTNTGFYTGVTTATLNIAGITSGATSTTYPYFCMVSGTCNNVSSDTVSLTVNSRPSIVTQPTNNKVCVTTVATFTVGAAGTAPTYQWQTHNGTAWVNLSNTGGYADVTTAALKVTTTAMMNGSSYRCIVGGACTPAVTSDSVTLTVDVPLNIVTQPTNKAVCPNANTTFEVTATGSSVTYQWQVNTGSGWTNLSNSAVYGFVNTNILRLSNLTPAFNNNRYRCVVNALCSPTTISGEGELTIYEPVAITTNPATSSTICDGDNISYTVGATGSGLSYLWYVFNGTGYVPLTNTGFYSGVTTPTLNITGITSGATSTTYSYFCVVSGHCNNASTSTLYLTVNSRPAITSHPVNVTTCDSTNNIQFSVSGTGTGLAYQWQVNTGSSWTNLSNGANVSGATTSALKFTKAYYSMNGNQYRCVVSGACTPSLNSSAATLTVTPLMTPGISIQANSTDICTGTLVTVTATPTAGGVTPTYQWKVNGVNAGTNSSTFTSTTLNHQDVIRCEMTTSYSCPTVTKAYSNAVQVSVTAYQQPTAQITSSMTDTICSGILNTFNVATTFAGTTPTYQWQLNGVNVGTNTNSYVTDSLNDKDIVRCLLTSSFKCPVTAQVSSNNIEMTVNQTTLATVSIGTGPDTNVCNGREVVFTADTSNGGATPSFQWIKNGVDLVGETAGTYSTFALKQGDEIQCRFTSSALCVFPVESDTMGINIDQPVAASVDVSVAYLGDNNYTFTATPTNGGTAPVYEWVLNGIVVPGITGPTYATTSLQKTDEVRVRMTSSHPCVITQKVQSRTIFTGIGGQDKFISDLKLYPNPNTGKFMVTGEYESAGIETAGITIINTLGQLIYNVETKVISGKLSQEIDLNNDPAPGVYIMRIDIAGKQELRRFNITK